MKCGTRGTEKKKLLFWKSVSLEKVVLRKVVQTLSKFSSSRTNNVVSSKNLFNFSSSRTNKMSSVQTIYSSLAVVELIKCRQFKQSIQV